MATLTFHPAVSTSMRSTIAMWHKVFPNATSLQAATVAEAKATVDAFMRDVVEVDAHVQWDGLHGTVYVDGQIGHLYPMYAIED